MTQSVLWTSKFSSNWESQWGVKEKGSWGLQNITVIPDPQRRFSKILRVRYPAGSASPTVARRKGVPLGGAQFYADLGIPPQTALRLSYYVRFSKNFEFVKGGKLPGLFGGKGNSGGDTPDGKDGFSTRFMWRRNGDGEVYAYLPTSRRYGTSISRGNWQFQPGVWHHLEQEVVLNQPNQRNGRIRVWFDGKPVLDKDGLTFRRVSDLRLDGLFFSTFFGGSDSSWATPKDVYVDFADFSVSAIHQDEEAGRVKPRV
ncbi:polysaccharide lyase [Leptothermofonsia sp. ETS-13]|uniref:polysaccharide lyase n=1 Tax=Leptothermofonsia sp. ETS-13 TaxID=3035696 RepID=UPI003BA24DC5